MFKQKLGTAANLDLIVKFVDDLARQHFKYGI